MPNCHWLVTTNAIGALADLRVEAVVHVRVVRDVAAESPVLNTPTAIGFDDVELVGIPQCGQASPNELMAGH